MTRRLLTAVLSAALVAGALSGCGPTMGDLPLPGSGVTGDTVTVKAEFDEALNLAQGAAVRVNGVASGRVQSVSVKDFKAIATMKVKRSAGLRSTASARLRYTTPLGELFVDVTNPDEGPLVRSGGSLDPARTSTAPTVEDSLSSASLLINGGGLSQLQTVTTELNKALGGREDRVRLLLERANEFVTAANGTSADFVRALDALASLSKTLRKNEPIIEQTLRDLRPAAEVLRQETPGFTRLLKQVEEFAGTANEVVGATREDLISMLRQMAPILDEFLDNRDLLGPSLNSLIKASNNLDNIVPGDYANLKLTLYIDQLRILGLGLGGSASRAAVPGQREAEQVGLGGLLGGGR